MNNKIEITICPKCGGDNLRIEKRLDGNIMCMECFYEAKYTMFVVSNPDETINVSDKLHSNGNLITDNGLPDDKLLQLLKTIRGLVRPVFNDITDPIINRVVSDIILSEISSCAADSRTLAAIALRSRIK